MTTLNPQVLGRAENAHRALLGRVLAGRNTYHQWVTLTVAVTSGGDVARAELVERVGGGLKIDPAAVEAVVAELAAGGLLREEDHRVRLTDAGRERYHDVRAAINEILGRVYADIPAADLATAGQVLTLVTGRIDAELAAA